MHVGKNLVDSDTSQAFSVRQMHAWPSNGEMNRVRRESNKTIIHMALDDLGRLQVPLLGE